MPAALELKKTVNLPRTAFPMKANLPANEPRWLAFWREMDLYGRLRVLRADAPLYLLHDGPPYANGNIHLGQALNKILKDMVVKSRSQMGMNAPFVPGWDCHGLPIENRVDRELGGKKEGLSPLQVRRLCRQYAEKYIHVQRLEFRRLGVFWDWQNDDREEAEGAASRTAIYRTLDHDYEAAIARELGRFFSAGSVYYGKKPVHWCPSCRTALAEAEVEYATVTDPSVYVAFPVRGAGERIPALSGQEPRAVIWTTTPWTLPSNRALCFHPDFVYVAVRAGGGVFIVARDLLPGVADAVGWQDPQVIASFTGRELADAPESGAGTAEVTAEPPYREMTSGPASRLILGEHVTLEQGTGIVHTAPGHGADDYYVGARYGIEPWVPVDDDGRFMEAMVPAWGGQRVFDANRPIVEDLASRGLLLATTDIVHEYPHCWRCRGPIVFRATPQWFIAMDQGQLRQRAVAAIHRTAWKPPFGEDRIAAMVGHRPDWCISRQRTWGVPIPVMACGACSTDDELVFVSDPRFFEHVAGVMARAGSDAWFGRPGASGAPEPYADESEARAVLLPAGLGCPRCGQAEHLARRFEIVDVWFESGASHAAVLTRPGLRWPADLYLEGHDQYRGWFHSSLLVAVHGRDGQAPYRQVITHGFTLDGQGRKMSKSLGNTVSPMELADTRGAEILRLWTAMVNFLEDMWISEEALTRHTDAYRKIRNTFRYILGNLHDFDPAAHAVPVEKMLEIDRYILSRFDEVRQRVVDAYDRSEFHTVAHALHQFCGVDLSAFYMDVIKDRLYTEAPGAASRRSGQTALWLLGDGLCRLMAPILCFTAEEVWQQLPPAEGRQESVHLELFPGPTGARADAGRWRALLDLREQVARVLEAARREKVIGAGLESQVVLHGEPPAFADEYGLPWQEFLDGVLPELATLFIVSQVSVAASPPEGAVGVEDGPLAGLALAVARHPGVKCPRCWTYVEALGADPAFPEVCARCAPKLAAGLAAGAWAGAVAEG